jgi:hypothetical protein
MTETTPSPLGNVITIDDERIKNHLDRVVRGSVEETLNALLHPSSNPNTLAYYNYWQLANVGRPAPLQTSQGGLPPS